jgi:hypothetical protein
MPVFLLSHAVVWPFVDLWHNRCTTLFAAATAREGAFDFHEVKGAEERLKSEERAFVSAICLAT